MDASSQTEKEKKDLRKEKMGDNGEIDESLLERYAALFPDKLPETEEEKEASQKLSAERKEFVKEEAARLGIKNPGTLSKKMDKMLKKRQKKSGGEKSAASAPKPPPAAKKAKDDDSAAVESAKEDTSTNDLDEQMRRILGQPSENVGRGAYYVNTPENLKKHLEATGGKWQLRFPPEPNGYLHIGHAKAMTVDFGIAKANGGNCYLRFDDTNPEAEKQEYIDAIIENVEWLGHTPFKTTYTSDYFDQMYDLACELIRRGKAYVCFMAPEQIKAQRKALERYHIATANAAEGEEVPFPHEAVADPSRERSPEENLKLFENMRQGRYKEGEATLRMKGDFMSKNPNMWDHMAYRIMFAKHHRTGDKWCIYPTYDYSHCLVDSMENITHSLCTLEFETRQAADSSYHWLLDALGMYHPKTWESSRCSVSCNVMSKRRLQILVHEKYVNGWDDPRLLTLAGLRRRGYTPSAINAFCKALGIARTSNEVCVSMNLLESCIRAELDHAAPRRFAVLDPVKVIITNFEEAGCATELEVPNHPTKGREDMGTRKVAFTKEVFIPREKFRLEMVKGYKGMVPGSPKNNEIRLLNAAVVSYEGHETDAATGNVTEIRVRAIPSDQAHKGISNVIWVGNDAITAEARLYGRLFKDCVVDGVEVHAEKAAKEKGVDFVDLIDPESLRCEPILVEPGIVNELEVGNSWQFLTVGYFCIDRVDSTKEKPIFNQIVSLKEDKGKAAPK